MTTACLPFHAAEHIFWRISQGKSIKGGTCQIRRTPATMGSPLNSLESNFTKGSLKKETHTQPWRVRSGSFRHDIESPQSQSSTCKPLAQKHTTTHVHTKHTQPFSGAGGPGQRGDAPHLDELVLLQLLRLEGLTDGARGEGKIGRGFCRFVGLWRSRKVWSVFGFPYKIVF